MAGVVGWPIAHSLSPLIHTIWAQRAGIDGYYIPVAAPPTYDEFARIIDALRTVGFAGVNVTLPHKEHALRYAGKATQTARRVGAANMLTFDVDDTLADNTDVAGFEAALMQAAEKIDKSGSVLVLGAGGAARAVAFAVRNSGFSQIKIANRTIAKAEAVAKDFDLNVVDWGRRNEHLSAAHLVVNTTSLGMTGQPPLGIDSSKLPPACVVADIVYAPLETPLLAAARERGCKTVDGLSMLMHQASPGFTAWFGETGVVDQDLRAALAQELKRRAAR